MKITNEEFQKLNSNIPIPWSLTSVSGETFYSLHNQTYKRLFLMNFWHDIFSKRFLGQKYVTLTNIYDDFNDSPILISNKGELMYIPKYYSLLDRIFQNKSIDTKTKIPSMSIILFLYLIIMFIGLVLVILVSKSNNPNVRELIKI